MINRRKLPAEPSNGGSGKSGAQFVCLRERGRCGHLALPLDQVYETLKSIAQDMREDGLVVDTTPVKQAVEAWAKELLPPGRHYVGLTPALNPLVLDETVTGIEAARPISSSMG